MKTGNGPTAANETGRRVTARRGTAKSQKEPEKIDHGGTSISIDERRQFIAEAAWYRAEARGFAPGGEIDDWLAAEAEVDDRLLGR